MGSPLTMAAALGNLASPVNITAAALGNLDLIPPGKAVISDGGGRKQLRLLPFDIVLSLSLPRREKESQSQSPIGGERLSGKVKFSRTNQVESGSSSSSNGDGKGNGEDEDEDEVEVEVVDLYEDVVFNWEAGMRKRMKELEEFKELEKKAEELQGRVYDGESDEYVGSDETEEEKKMRVRKELEKVAKEQAERRATAKLMFDLGQKAYGRGMYGRSIEFLEAALTIIPRPTLFGGEIQIWLAMAYEANSRHADCIALYRQLEKKHPIISIRRQAAELRCIMQAPKIKITQEEMVTIPLIGSSYDSYASTWTDKEKYRPQMPSGSTTNQLSSSRDYVGDLLKWKPPVGLENNTAFWAAVTLWLGLVGAALFLQR